MAVSQRKRKTPAGPYAQSVRESYNSDSESESEFERFSKRKRRFTQKEQQSAEHSSMEENIRDMKCTLKLLYEKVEANEKSLKELKARYEVHRSFIFVCDKIVFYSLSSNCSSSEWLIIQEEKYSLGGPCKLLC